MITKELFISVMEKIQKYHSQEEQLYKALKPFGIGFTGSGDEDSIELLLITVLSAALNDNEHEWISYFVYERDCDLSKPCIFKDNVPVDTSDWGKVYDLITSGV